MKELYIDAELELVKFSIYDVITTSSETEPETEPTAEETPNENDGPIDSGAFTAFIPA